MLFLGTGFVAPGEGARADEAIAILVSSGWTGPPALTLPTLQKLYLGKRTRLHGRPIHCFDLAAGSEIRKGFIRSVLQKSERELEQYWIEQALTGGHLPPREVASGLEMLREVARDRDAIGYLDYKSFQAMVPKHVRLLAVSVKGERLVPTNAAYPIRFVGEHETHSRQRPGAGPASHRAAAAGSHRSGETR